jgi:hypothetical protein
MPKLPGKIGGAEEDRTPDLLIAKEAAINNINGLDGRCVAINSVKYHSRSTN